MCEMINEATISVPDGYMFYRHNQIDQERTTLLFLHGLGESGLCFVDAFHEPALKNYNIIVPDLLGYVNLTGSEGHGPVQENYVTVRGASDG